MARAHRPAVGGVTLGAERNEIEAVWRIESARIVSALARFTGDFELAEDVAQEALAEALVAWPRDGTPNNPVGWLLATGRRRAIDAFRRQSALDERYATLARHVEDEAEPEVDRVEDDVLALVFVACHPVLSPEAGISFGF